MDSETAKQQIRDKIGSLAKALGNSAEGLGDDAFIPQADILDSAATMELIMWLEQTFKIAVPDDDLTIENFGTVTLIAGYVERNA